MSSASESERNEDLLIVLNEISSRQNVSAEIANFLALYFSDADADAGGTGEDSPEALHGAAVQHFQLGRRRLPGQAVIAVYTPDFDRHGWHSSHTVIDIVTDDMPFLVDSITMLINRHGLTIHRLLHPLLAVKREMDGAMVNCAARGSPDMRTESWIHIEIDRVGEKAQLEMLRSKVGDVLADVRAAVEDYAPMRQKILLAVNDLVAAAMPDDDEAADFLRWMGSENFVFLGYAHYLADPSAGELKRSPDAGLGLLRRADHPSFGQCLAGIPRNLTAMASSSSALTLAKADSHSTLHRQTYLDFVGVCYRDRNGNIVGEHVFVGLYAMHVFHVSTSEIPGVRRKIALVRSACGFAPGSYRDKSLVNVLETYPREELIEIGVEDLQRIAAGIVLLLEQPRVRVFMRNDPWGRYVSVLVYLPRDRYDTTVRHRITGLLKETLQADCVDFFLLVGESPLARLHLVARLQAGARPDYDPESFERGVARIVRGWRDELLLNLVELCGEGRGSALLRRYASALPLAYQDEVPPTSAVTDLEYLDAAESSGRIGVKLNAPYGDDGSHQHIKLFMNHAPRPLSSVLPIFENLGVSVLSEQPFRLSGSELHIADFAVRLPDAAMLDPEPTRRAFIDLVEKLLHDEAENDGYNRLTLLAGLDHAQITILRAYGRYLRQAGLRFSPAYIERSLAAYPRIARLLVDLFVERLSSEGCETRATEISAGLVEALAVVENLDDDRILSGFRMAIEATVRTNAWQFGADGKPKPYLSFKVESKQIPFMPKPVPLYEIFVYSTRMEGIHLRGARVARGGLRWSDRMEDFRTEVLGLVKAQMVKNAVIVPLGSKGGFVCKRLPPPGEREAWQAEGIACYSTLIRGMLDLTDNLVNGQIVPPQGIRRRDGDDPYLVVAADKGTASFSDIANSIALEYGFWLGDAFASGGSVGYDHKKMGITARGAWEAVKRHFRGLGLDTQSEPFSVVGIGDMSGDVFGNGMLLSRHIRLLAAFDHRHIFIDPDPDPEVGFAERQRLFALSRSSWEDYDKSLISAGGGVWPRTMKSIPLSQAVRDWLGTDRDQMAPTDLISLILKAPADLLYNGGIGTYVKASSQSHLDANDRSNDVVRVDANELRAKVIGEGGNLGLTQKARIEFALAGGRIFTDAIDNSAGVDCSDHEVNIKILLSGLVAAGDMTGKQRDALLASMTDDVAHLVLTDNYRQTEAISLEVASAHGLLNAHTQLMHDLQAKGALDRVVEFLPDDKMLAEREQMRHGLTAPEIAVLLAYTKITLKEAILASALPNAPELGKLFADYFPERLAHQCERQLSGHPLKREIVTTQLVNRLVDRMGTTFVMQLGNETGADPAQVAAAWYAASELIGVDALWREIEALDLKLPVVQQYELMWGLRTLVASATRRIIAVQPAGTAIAATIERYREVVSAAVASACSGRSGSSEVSALIEAGNRIVGAFELVDLAAACGQPLDQVAAASAQLDEGLGLEWFARAIDRLPADNRWQARARSQLAGELRKLRQKLLQNAPDESKAVFAEARRVVEELKRETPHDLAMLSAGLAEIRRLLLV